MARPKKLWSLDPRRGWIGKDHQNLDRAGNAGKFIIAKLFETKGQSEDKLTKKDIQFLTVRYQERLQEHRGEKLKEKMLSRQDTIQHLFDRYLWDFVQPRRSKGTFVQYRTSLTYFIEANGNFGIDGYNDLMEIAFENHLLKKGLSDGSIFKHQSHIQAAFTWLWKKRLIPRQIFIEKRSFTKSPTHAWSVESLKELEAAVFRSEDPYHVRIFMMARYGLMRNSEIWSMPLNALDQRSPGLDLVRGVIQIRDVKPLDFVVKKRQGRNIKMGNKLVSFLRKDLGSRGSKEVWYLDDGQGNLKYSSPSALSRIFKTYREQLGLTGQPLHTLRKSGITEALDRGGALEQVARWAGHSSPAVTLENYVDWENIDMENTVNLLE